MTFGLNKTENIGIVSSIILLTIMLNGMPPVHASTNANLFVSAENSLFNNYFSGPQVIQVVVSDPDINRLDQAYGEPVVTVNGKRLHMAQATDGNWYAYFADRNQAIAAANTAPLSGKGLNFGGFCGPTSTFSPKTGVTYSDTKGFTLARGGFGSQNFTIGTPITSGGLPACTNTQDTLTSFQQEHVVRQNKTLNNNPSGFNAAAGSYPNVWPIIQLYDFSAIPSTVTVDYQKAGGDQITTLTFDRIPQNLITVKTDNAAYPANSQVFLTMNDPQLNIDPTEDDSWTWGASSANNTLYYEAFTRNGARDADGTAGMQNLIGNLTTIMFNHNGKLTVNPAAQGVRIIDFAANGKQILNGSSTARGDPATLRTASIGLGSEPITFIESGGVNTGIFANWDGSHKSTIVTVNDPSISGKSATFEYNDITSTIYMTNATSTTKNILLAGLDDANSLVQQDRIMDAADKLLDVIAQVQTSVADPLKTQLTNNITSTIYSYMIAATPGGIHDYPVQCNLHEMLTDISPNAPGQLVFTYSSSTHMDFVNKPMDKTCIPYLIRGATVTSAAIDNSNKLTIHLTPSSPPSKGRIIVSLDRSLLDYKDGSGNDKSFTSLVDGIQNNHQENNTATIRLLTIPFPASASEVKITSGSQCGANAGTTQTVGPNVQVTLDASASTCTVYSWTQISGPPVKLSSSSTAHPTFTSPNVASGQKIILKFVLTASDANGQSSTSTVTIIVANQPIIVITDKSQYNIGEAIQITGSVNPITTGTPITLKIINPLGNVINVDQLTVNNGAFTKSFISGSPLSAATGTYTVQVQYGDKNMQASTTFDIVSPVLMGKQWNMGMSKDGTTTINIATSTVTSGKPLSIALSFIDAKSSFGQTQIKMQKQNYEIIIKQTGQIIFDKTSYAVAGDDMLTTPDVLKSSEPVDIEIKLLGQGDPTNPKAWIGSTDSIMATSIVPEFGPIVISALVIAFASIIIFARLGQRIRF